MTKKITKRYIVKSTKDLEWLIQYGKMRGIIRVFEVYNKLIEELRDNQKTREAFQKGIDFLVDQREEMGLSFYPRLMEAITMPILDAFKVLYDKTHEGLKDGSDIAKASERDPNIKEEVEMHYVFPDTVGQVELEDDGEKVTMSKDGFNRVITKGIQGFLNSNLEAFKKEDSASFLANLVDQQYGKDMYTRKEVKEFLANHIDNIFHTILNTVKGRVGKIHVASSVEEENNVLPLKS